MNQNFYFIIIMIVLILILVGILLTCHYYYSPERWQVKKSSLKNYNNNRYSKKYTEILLNHNNFGKETDRRIREDPQFAFDLFFMFGNFKYAINGDDVLNLSNKPTKILELPPTAGKVGEAEIIIAGMKTYPLNDDFIFVPKEFIDNLFRDKIKNSKLYPWDKGFFFTLPSFIEGKREENSVTNTKSFEGKKFSKIDNNRKEFKKIFQTFSANVFPEDYLQAANSWINKNPQYSYYYFNDYDMKKYMLNRCDKILDGRAIKAFEKIKPYAFKCDLWRLCILYNEGGVYADIKTECVIPLDNFITEKDRIILVADRFHEVSFFNGIIISDASNPLLLKFITDIVENIEQEKYGRDALDITGPLALGNSFQKLFPEYDSRKKLIDKIIEGDDFINHSQEENHLKILNAEDGIFLRNILFQNKVIFHGRYNHKLTETNPHKKINGRKHYSEMYAEKDIF